jgi:hypothetical protein
MTNWTISSPRRSGNQRNRKVGLDEFELIAAKASDEENTKPKKSKVRELTPEIVEESSLDNIQEDSVQEVDSADTSLEAESSIEQPVKRRGRPRKSASATPKAPSRARSMSAQPVPAKTKTAPAKTASKKIAPPKAVTADTGVRGRKPKLAAVPETQLDVSITEEDEVEEVMAPRRQGSAVPAPLTKPSFEVNPVVPN